MYYIIRHMRGINKCEKWVAKKLKVKVAFHQGSLIYVIVLWVMVIGSVSGSVLNYDFLKYIYVDDLLLFISMYIASHIVYCTYYG